MLTTLFATKSRRLVMVVLLALSWVLVALLWNELGGLAHKEYECRHELEWRREIPIKLHHETSAAQLQELEDLRRRQALALEFLRLRDSEWSNMQRQAALDRIASALEALGQR